MKYILIGGAPNVGKTGTIYRLADYLIKSKGFADLLQLFPKSQRDFMTILEGKTRNGEKICIGINSAADTPDVIQSFKEQLDENKNISIIISSIRDNNFYPRKEFFEILGINEDDVDVELPLAKITRRDKNRKTALKWYRNKTDKLLIKLLEELYI